MLTVVLIAVMVINVIYMTYLMLESFNGFLKPKRAMDEALQANKGFVEGVHKVSVRPKWRGCHGSVTDRRDGRRASFSWRACELTVAYPDGEQVSVRPVNIDDSSASFIMNSFSDE